MESKGSPTAKPTQDTVGLGRTPGQRGAEVIAGLRAQLIPSPVTKTLSTFTGRMFAQILMGMENRAAVNFVIARYLGFKEFVRQALEALTAVTNNITVVDLAAGFNPRNFDLAQEWPNVTFIEIDLPDVVAEKEKRLQKAYSLVLPSNIQWLSADLGVDPLHKILENQQVHVVTAEGLNAYFTPAEVTQIAANIRPNLVPGGWYVSDIPWKTGMDKIAESARFFSRQAGEFKCILNDKEEAAALMQNAGYDPVDVMHFSELPFRADIPEELIEFAFLVRAQKPTKE
ncbi:MAG: hypothetical protein Kow0080_24580 [Candidatus Promineifilaceae bacterium]